MRTPWAFGTLQVYYSSAERTRYHDATEDFQPDSTLKVDIASSVLTNVHPCVLGIFWTGGRIPYLCIVVIYSHYSNVC